MASSGSITTSSHEGRSLKFTWKEKSQSVANNSTTITWELVGAGSSDGYVKCGGFYVKIDGDVKVDKSTDTRKEVWIGTVVASGTATISHKSDGTKDFDVVINAGIYEYARNSKKEGTFTLNTIARASTITSASSVTLGNACNVKWTPASTSFYYKLKFSLSDWSKTISVGKPGTTSEYAYDGYTIPTSLASYITSGTSASMKVTLYTYSNSSYETQIGSSSSKTFTVKVPNGTIPDILEFDIQPVNLNPTVSSWGIFLKGYTKAKIICEAEGVSGSTIEKYVLTGGYSTTVSSMPYTGAVLTKAGEVLFSCEAIDTRGRTSPLVETGVNVIDYSNPSITNMLVTRDSNNASKVTVKVSYQYSSVEGRNSASATLYYRKSSSTSYEEYGTISNGSEEILDVTFDDTSSYVFQVVVTDALGNTDKDEAMISTMKVIMDFRDGGKGLGIGKIAESDRLEVGFESEFFEDAGFEKNVSVSGTLYADNISSSSIGLDTYNGNDLIIDKGKLSTNGEHYVYFYHLKPFNLIFLRMYIAGFSSDISASSEAITLCKIDGRFKPSGTTALTGYCAKECVVLANTNGEIRCRPRGGLSTGNGLYISGMYKLVASSDIYV